MDVTDTEWMATHRTAASVCFFSELFERNAQNVYIVYRGPFREAIAAGA